MYIYIYVYIYIYIYVNNMYRIVRQRPKLAQTSFPEPIAAIAMLQNQDTVLGSRYCRETNRGDGSLAEPKGAVERIHGGEAK